MYTPQKDLLRISFTNFVNVFHISKLLSSTISICPPFWTIFSLLPLVVRHFEQFFFVCLNCPCIVTSIFRYWLVLIGWFYESKLCCFCLICLKANLKHPIAQCVAIERLYSDNSFIIICHCDETKSFTFVCLQITNHLNALDGSEWPEKLP